MDGHAPAGYDWGISARTPVWPLEQTEAAGEVRGYPLPQEKGNLYSLSYPAASLLLPPAPSPRRSPAAGPEVGREGIAGAALTWLAASGAGGQQRDAQTESRGDEQQQSPRPHCPAARRGRRSAAPGGSRPVLSPCSLRVQQPAVRAD